jgi:hypothetical protein
LQVVQDERKCRILFFVSNLILKESQKVNGSLTKLVSKLLTNLNSLKIVNY